MSAAVTCLLLAATLAAPAPAKPKDRWVGTIVCLKGASVETYRRTDGGEFELQKFTFRYLDLRVVEEKGDFVAVQNDEAVVWVKKEVALRPRDAIDYFTAQLDKDPTDQRAISCRCASYMAAGDYDRALRDAEEAVRMNPDSPAWRNNRGEVLVKRKEYDKAIAEFTTLLEESPDHQFSLMNRGEAYVRTRQFDKALADLTAALKARPGCPALHMNVARCLATAKDPKVRDGKKAVEAAQKALDLFKFKDGRLYDTAAAAYAAAGDFDKAVEYQQRAFDDGDFMKDDGPGARKRLQLYRDKKDFTDE
ncbi:MAG TPA: tetratricopeptide repeat protein [Gemmataceae bacterium]|nr:tetratricopeptide repeat protein [Gemmataceae bacterium]